MGVRRRGELTLLGAMTLGTSANAGCSETSGSNVRKESVILKTLAF